ncbi:uncharacterized protein C4orf50 homolog [Phyllostomus hastatus]|uniref:uncharacterized protein C4orf50 homolog n=1 Tax=Phyllostomus hastatus TaxID=9423 RepID=UPI001E67F40A|nr:uncharacterized protein C4orf50 homolog [Phyllostomus hastatus]
MEPAATGRAERTFSYVVRAPGGDGFDVMNVDLKIDTAWIFQDAEGGDEERGCLPEAAAAAGASPDLDTGVLREQLEFSEQKLLAAVDKYVRSESGLRSRIQELELSERRLLRKVDQLRARVCQERGASLRAQEQLEALQGELASQVLEKERAARRQRWRLRRLREQLRYKDEALGQQTAALERCRRTQRRQLGLARQQERALREQVRRLERDVRRLCRAAGLLLAELDAPAPGRRPPLGPTGPRQALEEEAAAWCALQARAELGESERDAAARRQREQREQRECSLRVQLEELRCYIFELKLSEIGLQGQVEDLTEQNRCLREELGARAPGQTVRSVAAAGPCSPPDLLVEAEADGLQWTWPLAFWEGLFPGVVLLALSPGQPAGAGEDAPGHIHDEWLSLPWEEALEARRRPGRPTSPHPGGAPGPGPSAGQPAEGPHTWGSIGAGGGPLVPVPGLETPAGLLRHLAGPALGQPAPAEPSWHEQTLLLIGGYHPVGPCPAGPLLPVELAWIPEQRPATTPAREPCLVLQMPTTPPWGPTGDVAALLLQGAALGQLRIQQVLDAGPSPATRAGRQPCWQHHQTQSHDAPLCEESPPTSYHRCPQTGPRDLNSLWKEGGGAPEWRPEERGARRTWGRSDEDLGDGCQRHQESHQHPSVEGGTGGPEGLWSPPRAAAPQAAASCMWPRREPGQPLPWGGSSVSTEGPEPPSGRQMAEEQVWGLLGGLPLAEEEGAPPASSVRAPSAKGRSPIGAWLLEEEAGGLRSIWGQEESRMWAGDALFLLRESPGDGGQGQAEKVPCPAGSSPGCLELTEGPSSEEREAQEVLCFVAEGGLPLSPTWALSPEGAEPTRPPRAPSQGHGSPVPTLDVLAEEMEACFQQLCVLKLVGTGGRRGAAPMLAGRDGRRELADPWQVLGSQGLETRPAREGDAKERHGDVEPGEALGAGQVLPELGLDSGDLRPGPGQPPELGQSLGEPSAALERARRSLRRFVSGLKEERSRVLQDNLRLRRDRERCHQRMRALQREGERSATRACTLARENGALLGDVRRLRGELDQYLQVIADLEDCNGKSYVKISELEEENGTLRGCLGRLRRATAESARQCKGVVRDVTRENRELKALISELGVSYRGLIQDVVVGVEDVVRALRGENERLLHRIRVLEGEVAVSVSVSADGGCLQAAQGKGKVAAVERAVQVTLLPEPPAPRVLGLPLEEAQGPAAGWTGPALGTEETGCRAESAAPSPAGTDAGAPGDLGGAAAHRAHLEKEEERPRWPADRGPARRSLRHGPQAVRTGGWWDLGGVFTRRAASGARAEPWFGECPREKCKESVRPSYFVAVHPELSRPGGTWDSEQVTAELRVPGGKGQRVESIPGGGRSEWPGPEAGTGLGIGGTDGGGAAGSQWAGVGRGLPRGRTCDRSACANVCQGVQPAVVPSGPRGQGPVGIPAEGRGGEERRQTSRKGRVASRASERGLVGPFQDPEEEEKEDPGLRARRLRHQVLTLQCQLRDQASAGRELQAARDEALRLRDQLQAQVQDLQQKQQEADLAVTPLKAKLASLVQKCRDRNQLLVQLLQELRGRGAADALLSEVVRGMVDDVALAEYAAAFLVPGLPETTHRLDFQPEEAAAVRAQKYLLNPETDSVLPRPACAESQPLAEAMWPAQTAPPASLELPLPPGPTPGPGRYPAEATPTSGPPARRPHGGGEGEGGAAPPAPRAAELRSPARILALHRELRHSIRSSSRAHPSPLEP